MLLALRAGAEATRALAYYAAAMGDRARLDPDQSERERAQRRADLLIPVVKGWGTEMGLDAASTNIQVHGGMGFIEETGAAQHLRDARIALIYEGTNGIQANDLVTRKLVRDQGAAVRELAYDMRATAGEIAGSPLAAPLVAGIEALERASAALLEQFAHEPARALAGSVPYLRLMGIVAGGWLMARGALAAEQRLEAGDGERSFLEAKIMTARFFADHWLSLAPALMPAILGGETVMEFDVGLL
jgi:hypothetical protein